MVEIIHTFQTSIITQLWLKCRVWQHIPSAFLTLIFCMSLLPGCYMQLLYCCQGVFFKIPSVSQRRCAFEMKGSGYYIWQLFSSIRINGLMYQNFLSMKCLAYLASLRMWYVQQQTDFRDLMVMCFVCRHPHIDQTDVLKKALSFYDF